MVSQERSKRQVMRRCPFPAEFEAADAEPLLGNYPDPQPGVLRPYEAQLWRWRGNPATE